MVCRDFYFPTVAFLSLGPLIKKLGSVKKSARNARWVVQCYPSIGKSTVSHNNCHKNFHWLRVSFAFVTLSVGQFSWKSLHEFFNFIFMSIMSVLWHSFYTFRYKIIHRLGYWNSPSPNTDKIDTWIIYYVSALSRILIFLTTEVIPPF